MYLRKLSIEGYKNFSQPFDIDFSQGLSVLVGENGTGKSAIVDALRLMLIQDDFDRAPISDTVFYRPFTKDKERAKSLRIKAMFEALSEDEKVAFLPWTDLDGKATLTLFVENKQNTKGNYKRELWGGASRASMFEKELFDCIECIYLPPLRDAEAKLREGRSSRIARLLKNLERGELKKLEEKGQEHSIVKSAKDLNRELAGQSCIQGANEKIRRRLREALGSVFGQDSQIQFSETNFNRIVESLRLFFFPELDQSPSEDMWRSLEENSLGYNNLLYLATILAELTEEDSIYYKAILIEEPEAHLHPQLQVRLLKYLHAIKNVQIIITTHSTVLAASSPLDSLIHLSRHRKDKGVYEYKVVPIKSSNLESDSQKFVERWLDVTKSNLLFAKGVILVEGIAEAMLLPILAKIVLAGYNAKQVHEKKKLPDTLEDAGVSVINMNGVYFKHFMQLFCNVDGTPGKGNKISTRCSGITDNDPDKTTKPTKNNPEVGKNKALELESKIASSINCRLYPNLKTFEYDLAMEGGNLNPMTKVFAHAISTDGPINKEYVGYSSNDWSQKTDDEKKEIAFKLFERLGGNENLRVLDKGEFAQALADKLTANTAFAIPDYIRKAVIWACGGNPDDA